MKDIDCCKDCKKRGTDCHGDVFYYNSSPICREFISDEPSVWEENTMLEEEIAALKEKFRELVLDFLNDWTTNPCRLCGKTHYDGDDKCVNCHIGQKIKTIREALE